MPRMQEHQQPGPLILMQTHICMHATDVCYNKTKMQLEFQALCCGIENSEVC